MPRFPASSCTSCGETHWGNPTMLCQACRPKGERRVLRGSPRRCLDCGRACAGERCLKCSRIRLARKPKLCVDCGAEISFKAKRCVPCRSLARMAERPFRPNLRLPHRRGRCLDLTRKGFRCPISWGPLDHSHCPHCFAPMRPDLGQCSRCTALELINSPAVPITATDAPWPVEGSKSWKATAHLLDLDLERQFDEDIERQADELARQDLQAQYEPGSPAAYRSLAQ